MSEQPIIKIEGLTHIYNTGTVYEKKALDAVSLSIQAGECVGLIGHTGSGKSTLIQHMNALLKPAEGKVYIAGEDINADKRRLKKIRECVGLVFQYPEHQLFEVTVYKDAAFGPVNMGLSREETDTRVCEALTLVGLPEELWHKSPFELSGGQKRRAAIAGVLAMRPDILVLDEPTAGLDPAGREEIFSRIKHMHSTLHNTVILVSHSMEDVARLADRIVVMSQGKIICDGSPGEVFAQSGRLEGAAITVPQIYALMSRLAEKGIPVPRDVFTVEAAAQVIADLAREMALTAI